MSQDQDTPDVESTIVHGWYDKLHRKFRWDTGPNGGYLDVVDVLPEEARTERRGKFEISVRFIPDE